ncbi:MAG TPA: DNA recombination protein RmuC, partial [Thermodesulfobacteriota bacterium]|nr:DNA recombination protein RmuC [Thermodesulfobacteriota bacterium]
METERVHTSRELQTQKGLIDQQLSRMNQEIEKVCSLMRELEKDRIEKFGELSSQLKTAGEQTAALTQITATLREALANTKARGQWGERMAEDILRIAGLVENVNYCRQKTIDGAGTRPDFTFLLPHDLRLNMDVKFPLDNYIRFLGADAESDKTKYRSLFLRDVRGRIKEVTSRDYIDPAQKTVDCVLLFIPNEQIYAFIHELDSSIFEHAIKNKVVFCSPITLFAVIAVIRQAAENFVLTQTSHEILSLLGRFKKRWDEFLKRLDVLGKRIGEAQQEYEAITTTRRRLLEKSFNELEALRIERGLPIAAEPEEYVAEPGYLEAAGQKQNID